MDGGEGRAYLCVKAGSLPFFIPVDRIKSVLSAQSLRARGDVDGALRLSRLLDVPAETTEDYALDIRVPAGRFFVLVEEVLNPIRLKPEDVLPVPVRVLCPENAFLAGIYALPGCGEAGYLLDMERLLAKTDEEREQG